MSHSRENKPALPHETAHSWMRSTQLETELPSDTYLPAPLNSAFGELKAGRPGASDSTVDAEPGARARLTRKTPNAVSFGADGPRLHLIELYAIIGAFGSWFMLNLAAYMEHRGYTVLAILTAADFLVVAALSAYKYAGHRRTLAECKKNDPFDYHDPQAEGMVASLVEVTEHSTAGWDDELWQQQFRIAEMIEQKKNFRTVEAGQKAYDQIAQMRADLDANIAVRKEQLRKREQLGMSKATPGTEQERFEYQAQVEAEKFLTSLSSFNTNSRDGSDT